MKTKSNPLPGAQPVAVEGEYLPSGVVWRATADALEAQLQEALAMCERLRLTINPLLCELPDSPANQTLRRKVLAIQSEARALHDRIKPAPVPARASPPPSRG